MSDYEDIYPEEIDDDYEDVGIYDEYTGSEVMPQSWAQWMRDAYDDWANAQIVKLAEIEAEAREYTLR